MKKCASSTFNQCPHQPLPTMTGPPMAVRVDPDTRPTITRHPVTVPLHWKEEVSRHLERNVALAVIERVPTNIPVTRLHPMVITPKVDSTPRRTVELQSLNRHRVRETHHTIPLAQQARAVRAGQWKTVLDTWNGFHSIEIQEEDRHKTTFLTDEGRFRYKRAPMGFLASQDAYTAPYDGIIADVVRETKCVDDHLLWDDKDALLTHWWRIIDFLILVGSNGIVLNPQADKFQFAKDEVKFAGFLISDHKVKHLPRYLNAIANFPCPTNIEDVRSWFGLVNQVSHYGQLSDIVAPFKPLLSPKCPFKWTPELEQAFLQSKSAIVDEIKKGVEIFDPTRRTCLIPDWSTIGVGYWLRQKHCECESLITDCCPSGWRITLAGSRFLHDAERCWCTGRGRGTRSGLGLEDTKFFTLGCNDPVVATDHKPLVKILGDKALGDIDNPRLFRLKRRALP